MKDNKNLISGFSITTCFVYAAALVSVVVGIIYPVAYNASVYFNGWSVALYIIGGVAGAALTLFNVTKRYGALVLNVTSLVAFVLFVKSSYLYLSEVFFAGFSMAAIGTMDFSYVAIVVLSLVIIIDSNITVWLLNKTEKAKKPIPEVAEVTEQ